MDFPKGSKESLYFSLQEGWEKKMRKAFEDGGHITHAFMSIGLTATEHNLLMGIPEYSDEIENGMALSEKYWLDWGRSNISDPKVNTKLFEIMTKRMFNWDKKVDKTDKDDSSEKNKLKEEARKFQEKYLKPENRESLC